MHPIGVVTRRTGLRADVIRAAHEWAGGEGVSASDDAFLCELRGHEIACIPGDPRNLKITSAADFALAEWLVESGQVTVPGRSEESGGTV